MLSLLARFVKCLMRACIRLVPDDIATHGMLVEL